MFSFTLPNAKRAQRCTFLWDVGRLSAASRATSTNNPLSTGTVWGHDFPDACTLRFALRKEVYGFTRYLEVASLCRQPVRTNKPSRTVSAALAGGTRVTRWEMKVRHSKKQLGAYVFIDELAATQLLPTPTMVASAVQTAIAAPFGFDESGVLPPQRRLESVVDASWAVSGGRYEGQWLARVLVDDLILAIGSCILVLIAVLIQTGSLFLTVVGIAHVALTAPSAYTIYTIFVADGTCCQFMFRLRAARFILFSQACLLGSVSLPRLKMPPPSHKTAPLAHVLVIEHFIPRLARRRVLFPYPQLSRCLRYPWHRRRRPVRVQ